LPATSTAGQKLNVAAGKIYGSTQKITDMIRTAQESTEVGSEDKKCLSSQMLFVKQLQEVKKDIDAIELELEKTRRDHNKVWQDTPPNNKDISVQKEFLEKSFLAQKKIQDLEKLLIINRKRLQFLEKNRPTNNNH